MISHSSPCVPADKGEACVFIFCVGDCRRNIHSYISSHRTCSCCVHLCVCVCVGLSGVVVMEPAGRKAARCENVGRGSIAGGEACLTVLLDTQTRMNRDSYLAK